MTADYIYTHDRIYNFLVRYFLLELSDPYFRKEHAAEIQENERLAYCRHMAAWLPYERHYNQIIQHIMNDKEDAENASSLFFLLPKSAPAQALFYCGMLACLKSAPHRIFKLNRYACVCSVPYS